MNLHGKVKKKKTPKQIGRMGVTGEGRMEERRKGGKQKKCRTQ